MSIQLISVGRKSHMWLLVVSLNDLLIYDAIHINRIDCGHTMMGNCVQTDVAPQTGIVISGHSVRDAIRNWQQMVDNTTVRVNCL